MATALGSLRGPRKLSRRRVRAIVCAGQSWTDQAGEAWSVAQVHRKDGLVRLQHAGEFRYVSFGELGRSFVLDGLS